MRLAREMTVSEDVAKVQQHDYSCPDVPGYSLEYYAFAPNLPYFSRISRFKENSMAVLLFNK